MKAIVIGVKRLSGVGKESGKPFDFAQCTVLRALEPVAKQQIQIAGFGFETVDLDLAIDAVPRFGQVKFPAEVELETAEIIGAKGIRLQVVGFRPVAAKVAA